MKEIYDVIIVGGGPAGIFTAIELSLIAGLDVLIMEKGKGLDNRHCPTWGKGMSCVSCSPCNMVSGLGGAGAYSDGKMTLSPEVGGYLKDYLGEKKARELIEYIDDIYMRFGATEKVYNAGEKFKQLADKASLSGLHLISVPIRHLGTDNCFDILKNMQAFLCGKVEIEVEKEAAKILVEEGAVDGVETSDGQKLKCRFLILAPGREGTDWLVQEAGRLKLELFNNPVDIGVRIELPKAVMEELTDILYEPKLEFYTKTFDDRVRTFCVCPGGEVTMECTGGSDPVITVNGHSYASRMTGNTNLALLVSTNFTQPFHQPIAYGRYIARLANLLSGGVLVQRLGDLKAGRRSTPERIERGIIHPTLTSATPGDLSFVLPYRQLKDITEMLEAMDSVYPGVASRHTLLYGVEVKFYSSRLKITGNMETEVANLFAIGDGAGVSRGLVQASISGVVAAREIRRRIEGLTLHS